MSVQPYWELTFDADGDVDTRQRDQLLAGVAAEGVTDLVLFSHGWNNDQSMATWLYDRFFAPFPGLLGAGTGTGTSTGTGTRVRLGYVGVLWPAMRFSDEPIPDFTPSLISPGTAPATSPGGRTELSEETCRALASTFPGQDATVRRLAELLRERPDSPDALGEFARLVRDLVALPAGSPTAAFAADSGDGGPQPDPAILADDPVGLCAELTAALQETGVDLGPDEPGEQRLLGGLGKKLWNGAHELLRQATYFAMKRRAGTVGQHGLGPALGRLSQSAGTVRVHLVGHSFGARLVSFALLGLPTGAHNVKSVTLLQGAFSHYAYARRLPGDASHSGALRDAENRVDGPVVSCFSSHDTALGVIYPLASRLSRDDSSLLGLGDRWGAMGHDGIQAVDGTRRATIEDARAGRFPVSGCVSVDVSAVVCSGSPPAGAHSDICHEELARVVLAAGRISH
ncbi:serine-threonine protein kinase [Streptomyces sp. RKAG337]|uniref:serine-threonine protein kinase n=1 Tax=Streptomyces sp. RKAG337 TaxID=2893404 RepID=UPI00203358B4|nr:serine-threonine protein kinase [Streptomyces sp. RKAG337]MCM2429307.1 serine-threonine protein kinase [Streptomyces sp. RKAG337]